MFGGSGTETVASATEWALTELMHNPESLKRAQQELADVVGFERRVENSDFEKLTYFKCVIKETLRLHPPIPVFMHQSSEATEVAGYHIPKGTRVMINTFSINRDKNSWEDLRTRLTHHVSCKMGLLNLTEATMNSFPLGLDVDHVLECSLECMQWRWQWLTSSILSHGSCLIK